MKELNFVLYIGCLVASIGFTAFWFFGGSNIWIELSGFIFLSSVVFFFAYLLEKERENSNFWKQKYISCK